MHASCCCDLGANPQIRETLKLPDTGATASVLQICTPETRRGVEDAPLVGGVRRSLGVADELGGGIARRAWPAIARTTGAAVSVVAPAPPPGRGDGGGRRSGAAPDYWATPHPEYAAALVLHWLLWGYSSRQVALTYDFACIAGLVYVQTLPIGS